MVDWPGQVSTVLFTGICSWHCAYCHNKELFKQPDISFTDVILPKLLERQAMVQHIIISGGEPSEDPESREIIKTLAQHGFKVGLHTNGGDAAFVEEMLPYLSFIGMDLKTSPDGYVFESLQVKQTESRLLVNVLKNIQLIAKSGIAYEFRTVLYKPYLDKYKGLVGNSYLLRANGVKTYVLKKCNDIDMSDEFTKEELDQILSEMKVAIIPIVTGFS